MRYNPSVRGDKMIVAFFGHSDFKERDICENDFISMLKGIINGENVDFYFGGYGAFDAFSYRCCCKLKKMNSTSINIELVYVTPYITESYQKNQTLFFHPGLKLRRWALQESQGILDQLHSL